MRNYCRLIIEVYKFKVAIIKEVVTSPCYILKFNYKNKSIKVKHITSKCDFNKASEKLKLGSNILGTYGILTLLIK
jgi:hypothetical protein